MRVFARFEPVNAASVFVSVRVDRAQRIPYGGHDMFRARIRVPNTHRLPIVVNSNWVVMMFDIPSNRIFRFRNQFTLGANVSFICPNERGLQLQVRVCIYDYCYNQLVYNVRSIGTKGNFISPTERKPELTLAASVSYIWPTELRAYMLFVSARVDRT